MTIPTNDEILVLLDHLDSACAGELETQWLDFKPWRGPREAMRLATEYAVCFANAEGGVLVLGVHDKVIGRALAIQGASGYDLDTWRQAIYESTRPSLAVEVQEISVPEGTGRLVVVRIPRGQTPPYGTSQGLYKKRVGKSCMPMDPQDFLRSRIASGAVDWSGAPAEGVSFSDLDPLEISRGRRVLHKLSPESDLLLLGDRELLAALGAVRNERVTHAGLLLFGTDALLARLCPQHQVHYVHQISATEVARSDSHRGGLLKVLERIEQVFEGPANPEAEVTVGFFRLRVPAYPIEVVREAVLNAVTHRDYSQPHEVLIRHTPAELVVVSPGGFIGGITPDNILRHEPISRNDALAQAFEKLRLVERAGLGRRRIFIPVLTYGKRRPEYETDGTRVVLRIFDGAIDERMAGFVARWKGAGKQIDLDGLLILSYLRNNAFLDTRSASEILQLDRATAKGILDRLAQPRSGILERRGRTKAATYHLAKGVARDLLGKAAYTKTRGLDPIRYAEMVRAFVKDHGSITPRECRELLRLGESGSARAQVSKYFRKWSQGQKAFLRREGKGPKVRYYPRQPGDPRGVNGTASV